MLLYFHEKEKSSQNNKGTEGAKSSTLFPDFPRSGGKIEKLRYPQKYEDILIY